MGRGSNGFQVVSLEGQGTEPPEPPGLRKILRFTDTALKAVKEKDLPVHLLSMLIVLQDFTDQYPKGFLIRKDYLAELLKLSKRQVISNLQSLIRLGFVQESPRVSYDGGNYALYKTTWSWEKMNWIKV